MTFKKLTTSLALALGAVAIVTAQNLQSVSRSRNVHADLLASQANVQKQIKVDATKQYIDHLYGLEEEPELDIYEEGWESQYVNCYRDANVPESAVIDVRKYHMPVPGRVNSPYGYRPRFGRVHKGMDLHLRVGDTVRAAFDGKVRLTRFERGGYGYYVVLRHPNGLETVYGHLSRFLVKPDQMVKAGDPIALGGNTGRSTGPHLHFETRYLGYAINPAAIFDFENQTTHTDTYTFNKKSYQMSRDYSPRAKRHSYAKGGKGKKNHYKSVSKSRRGGKYKATASSKKSKSKSQARSKSSKKRGGKRRR